MPRSEKSLGFLCQKFVMLFLEAPVRVHVIACAFVYRAASCLHTQLNILFGQFSWVQ